MRILQTEETAREEEQAAVPVDDSTQAFITQLTEVLTMIGQENADLEKSGALGKPSEEIMHAVKELIEAFPLNEAAKAAGVDKKEAMLAMLEWIDTAQTLAEESNHLADDAHKAAEDSNKRVDDGGEDDEKEEPKHRVDDAHSFIDYLPQAGKTLSRISTLGTGNDLDRYAIRQRKVRCKPGRTVGRYPD